MSPQIVHKSTLGQNRRGANSHENPEQIQETCSWGPSADPSQEFAAFEELARKVIRTSKTELDEREADYKRQRPKG